MSIKETMSRIQRDLDESLTGNQIGPSKPPNVEPAPHMRGYAPADNTPAVRARQAQEDRNRFGAPPKPTKP
jgi:hypothetical protein